LKNTEYQYHLNCPKRAKKIRTGNTVDLSTPASSQTHWQVPVRLNKHVAQRELGGSTGRATSLLGQIGHLCCRELPLAGAEQATSWKLPQVKR
jgi:hypothetical protein